MIKKLPVGIEDFEKIRTEGFYYVDKTGLIAELLNNWGEVNLFTRPRRFGKSLNMNMLKCFFEYGCNASLFDGLEIAANKELCREYMGKFPVIYITLKGVDSMEYETSRNMLCSVIGREALRFRFLLESCILSEQEKEQYGQLIKADSDSGQGFVMSDTVLRDSLLTLSLLLYRHYGQKVILLIDEYDVPLDKAQQFGYYDKMMDLVRAVFHQAMKGNRALYFAVLTGCLKIAKESVFTGLNNLQVMSITDTLYDEHFGFLDGEVKKMLAYYDAENRYELLKEWYDGYRFGNVDVYCPWDVINYCARLRGDRDSLPKAFWLNTSGNDIIRTFLKMAKPSARRELEVLVEGGCVAKRVNQELTYRDLYRNIDNLWSVLFTTGYLTKREEEEDDIYQLVIPNLEIRQIFKEQILEWFQEEARKDPSKLDAFCDAFAGGDAETACRLFQEYLHKTISIRDTSARKEKKENFYHGILLGLLSHREDWDISSNAESGDGFSDILVEIESKRTGIVIEVKYPDGKSLEAGCKEALKQIECTGYEDRLKQDGITTIYKYGIACWKKTCLIQMEKEIMGS